MDLNLNALPKEEVEEEVVEEEAEEERNSGNSDEEDAYTQVLENVEADVEVEAEELFEFESSKQEHESGADIMRREREERRKRMQLLKGKEETNRPAKFARTSTSSVPSPPKAEAVKPRPHLSLPEGWLDCPSSGDPIFKLIPSKVPLGEFFNQVIEPGRRYSWKQVLRQQRAAKREVSLVIDLTNTSRYYSPGELDNGRIRHLKIACRGRNEVPDNESVNRFVYEATKFLGAQRKENSCILVHCTHGFNRTGYMICHYLIRSQGMTVEQALQTFASARPPGIYKKDYVQKLYEFYHERKPEPLECPSTPEWKRPIDLNGDAHGNDDDDEDGVETTHEEEPEKPMTIDDVLGDPIPSEQQYDLQKYCVTKLGLKVSHHGPLSFPGSQPVSLDRKHLQLLRQKYYYATWKADGTRYMMLITYQGCYLIDRKFTFRRIQMRFPIRSKPSQTHHLTLLDGEMVIDKDPATGAQFRRYLVYDMMLLNDLSLKESRFCDRWEQIEAELVEPRKQDQAHNKRYDYNHEIFRVRRKDFWLLSTTEKLLHDFIPNLLTHEADGLIFQAWEDGYVPRTHQGLLKWKYAHMNSVDFLMKYSPEREKYCLYLMDRGNHRILDGANVKFPESSSPADYDGKIIECSWNPEEQVWEYMRERVDKEHANAFGTYEKVMHSIHDNITEEVLFEEIREILRLPMYIDRIRRDQQQAALRKKQHTRPPGGHPPKRM